MSVIDSSIALSLTSELILPVPESGLSNVTDGDVLRTGVVVNGGESGLSSSLPFTDEPGEGRHRFADGKACCISKYV